MAPPPSSQLMMLFSFRLSSFFGGEQIVDASSGPGLSKSYNTI